MFTWLKSSVALTMVLTCVGSSWGAEPAKSVLNGAKPAVYDAPAPFASHSSVQGGNAISSPCESCGGSSSSGPLYHSRMSCGSSCGSGCGAGCGHHGCGHHGGGCNSCDGINAGQFCSRCNMIPHVAYVNQLKSYYYFRPYQGFHVRVHQNEVTTYGGDPRDPYANLMFHSIYPELEAAWAEEALHNGSPFEDDVPQEHAPAMGDEEPADAPVPEPARNTSTTPASPIRPHAPRTTSIHVVQPTIEAAAMPSGSHSTFRTRR